MNAWEKEGLEPEERALAVAKFIERWSAPELRRARQRAGKLVPELHVDGPLGAAQIASAIRAAVKGEREACAAIAETHPLAPDTTTGTRQRWLREAIAGAIRRESATKGIGEGEPDGCDNCESPMDGHVASTSDVCLDCWGAALSSVRLATGRAEKAEERVRELEAALQPFAKEAEGLTDWLSDKQGLITMFGKRDSGGFTVGDVRRAHAALTKEAPDA